MYQDYLDAILKFYEQKKVNNDLPPRLLNPTPSKIRDECAFVYRSRFEKRDQARLMSFFEVYEGADILKAIERFDIDKFRPLTNYLKEATEKTDDKNIELLAWLLNFPQRPYNKHTFLGVATPTTENKEVETSKNKTKEDASGEVENSTEAERISYQSTPTDNRQIHPIQQNGIKKMRGVIVGAAIIVSGLLAAVNFKSKDDKGCMIWVNDHYERVSCDSSGSNVSHLRRITRPDTLTEKDIGKIWYRKRGEDSLDFYTTGGRDPVNPNLDLKRLTAYIFEKYLKKSSNAK